MGHADNSTSSLMVSVSCTVYNHESYLKKCLEGFVMQITNFDFEVIVHDDASTDKSADIILQYASKYPNIIKPIIEKDNQYSKGAAHLNEIIFSHLHGKYIALCEGDDYWTDPFKLQKQVDYLESHKAVNIAVHNAIRAYSDGKTEPFNDGVKPGVYDLIQCLYKGWFTPTASFLFRNNLELSPLWFENGSNGDMAVLYSNLMLGKLYYSDEIMSVYNYGTPCSMSSSTSRQILYNKKLGMLKSINVLSSYKYSLATLPVMLYVIFKKTVWSIKTWMHIK